MEGRIANIYAPTTEQFESRLQHFGTLVPRGMQEDQRHFGVVKKAGVREKEYPKGTIIPNRRQVSLVAAEELEEIAERLGIPEVKAEWLGANIKTEGIQQLTQLPPNTKLHFEGGSTLIIYGETKPCIHPGKIIQQNYSVNPSDFVKTSKGKRGVVGWVDKPGIIRAGYKVQIETP